MLNLQQSSQRLQPPDPMTDLADAVQRRTWADVGFCRGCGYALRGLPEARCPECGKAFDPHDPATMRVPGWRPPYKLRPPPPRYFSHEILVAAIGSSLCLVGCAYPIGILGWGGVFFAWWRRARHRKIERRTGQKRYWMPEGNWPWRSLVLAMFAVTIWVAAWTDICPHARYYGLGGFGIAWSDNGGPCANHVTGLKVQLGKRWYFFTDGHATRWL